MAQFEVLIHLDCFKRTDLDANLAAHAYRDVDIEHLRIKLRFAHVVGLLVVAFRYVDALRRAFLLTNLARDAPQPRLWIGAVENQKRKVAVVFRKRVTLLGILNRGQAVLLEIASDEVPGGDRHSPKYSRAEHRFA